jgi:hypothetical protein
MTHSATKNRYFRKRFALAVAEPTHREYLVEGLLVGAA